MTAADFIARPLLFYSRSHWYPGTYQLASRKGKNGALGVGRCFGAPQRTIHSSGKSRRFAPLSIAFYHSPSWDGVVLTSLFTVTG